MRNMQKIRKEIARKNNTTVAEVEREMQAAIAQAWNDPNKTEEAKNCNRKSPPPARYPRWKNLSALWPSACKRTNAQKGCRQTASPSSIRGTNRRTYERVRRFLLFYLYDQTYDADDNKEKLKKL